MKRLEGATTPCADTTDWSHVCENRFFCLSSYRVNGGDMKTRYPPSIQWFVMDPPKRWTMKNSQQTKKKRRYKSSSTYHSDWTIINPGTIGFPPPPVAQELPVGPQFRCLWSTDGRNRISFAKLVQNCCVARVSGRCIHR